MKYRVDSKSGNKLSVLGFGCMRFPSSMEKTEQLIKKAIEGGINYFDTAYIYNDSERKVGEIFAKNNLREQVYLATKLPLRPLRKREDFDKFFYTQLERLKTNYIDYYLMHMLTDLDTWNRLVDWGIKEWIIQKKKSGEIKQLGFSFHGRQQEFLKILDAYDWDFCQIQYNYSDENNQAGVTGLKAAHKKGIPVMIMEPLLGGKLASGLPKKAQESFRSIDAGISYASWGFRWLFNQAEVTVVLSGMNADEQLEDNLKTAALAEVGMLGGKEEAAFLAVKNAFQEAQKVACTGCNYCMPCPQGVNIPGCFNAYNTSYAIGFAEGIKQYILAIGGTTEDAGTASRCIQCGNCEQHCPQGIEIRKCLKTTEKRLEPFWMKIGLKIARKGKM